MADKEAEQTAEDWRITIDVPLSLPHSERERLFTAVADAVYEWEPDDREGWDAFVAASAADHTVQAYAERLEAENQRLTSILSASDGAEREWHNLATIGVTASAKWKTERDLLQSRVDAALSLLRDTPGWELTRVGIDALRGVLTETLPT